MPLESPQQPNQNTLERQLDALSNIKLNQFRPEVGTYLQNLITQAQGILSNYNEKLDTAPIETLQTLQLLITKLKHVAHTKEIPPEDSLTFKHTTQEGKEVILDCTRILHESRVFYQEHSLAELAKELPSSIELSEASRTRIKEALAGGFDKAFFFPSAELLSSQRDKIIEECATKPVLGLSESDQYNTPAIDGSAKASVSQSRPYQKFYLLLYRSSIPQETKGMIFSQAEKNFAEKKWNSLTLDEYLLLQRKECELNLDHRFDAFDFDSGKTQQGFLLDAHCILGGVRVRWVGGFHHIAIDHLPFDLAHHPGIGVYPSVVIELE